MIDNPLTRQRQRSFAAAVQGILPSAGSNAGPRRSDSVRLVRTGRGTRPLPLHPLPSSLWFREAAASRPRRPRASTWRPSQSAPPENPRPPVDTDRGIRIPGLVQEIGNNLIHGYRVVLDQVAALSAQSNLPAARDAAQFDQAARFQQPGKPANVMRTAKCRKAQPFPGFFCQTGPQNHLN